MKPRRIATALFLPLRGTRKTGVQSDPLGNDEDVIGKGAWKPNNLDAHVLKLARIEMEKIMQDLNAIMDKMGDLEKKIDDHLKESSR